MQDPTKKLKLVCSFNAKFGYSLPGHKTRYAGGETRIISVDPTTLTFLNLRFVITQRFSLTTNDFILKYKLPCLQTDTGTDTRNDKDMTLVLLDNDDDVLCMVEEYERVVSCGNKFSRLWVYVFGGNCDGLRWKTKHIDSGSGVLVGKNSGLTGLVPPKNKNLGLIGLVPQVKENLGLTGLAPLTKENVGSNESLKKSLVVYGDNGDLNKNNVGRKKVRGDSVCLRKFVLKQQMLLARQREQNGYADSKLGVNVGNYEQSLVDSRPDPWSLSTAKNDVNNSLSSDSCGRNFDGYGKFGVNVGSYDQPLTDSRPDAWTLSTAKNDVNNSLSSDSSERKSNSYGSLTSNEECFGVNSTLGSNSCQLSNQDSNLIEGKSSKIRPVECSKGMSGIDEQCLNRENDIPSTLHCNALSSDVCSGVSSHCCTRIHQIQSRDVSDDQGLGLSFNKRSHCVGELGGKVSVGARSNSVLGVLKHAQAMIFYHPNSSRPRSGLHRLSKLVKMRKLSDFSKETIQKQDNLSVEQSQVYRYGDGHPSIDLNKEHFEVKYEDKYDCETITKCNSDHDNAKVSAPSMILKNVEHYASRDMTYSANTELVRSGLIDSYGISNGTTPSTDLSSYNPSSSSSSVANPALCQLSSEGSGSLRMAQLKYTGTTDEAKQVAETEESSQTEVHSVIDILNHWDKGLSLKEEIQGDPPVNPDGKVDSAKNETYSNLIDGISSDSAAFCTYLATRGLQIIQGYDLEYIKELGSGNYGTVYHGKWKGSDVAIKKIKRRFLDGVAKEDNRLVADFWKEAQILSRLHHPNIVSFYGIVTDGPITKLATVTEYMRNGSLKQVLQRKCRTIDRRKRLIIAMDAAFGMEYLHEKGIVHFDLKSHNFLVNMSDPQRPVCKIGDLGLSKIKQRTLVSGGIRGTIPWMAPELLSSSTNLVTEKIDVYSFGIVMWELLTGEEPYANMRSKDIIAAIIQGKLRPEIPSWCEPSWRSLMERCWSSDPKSRPSFSEIAKELRVISASMNIK